MVAKRGFAKHRLAAGSDLALGLARINPRDDRVPIDLKPDCNACAALCCVMLPFDEGAEFAFDKPGGVACRHLLGHACAIHDSLSEQGFAGCLRYDCLGAGQRVVQEVFAGKSWRREPDLLAPMEAAFRALRRLHEDHALLTSAAKLPLTATEETARRDLLARLAAEEKQSEASLAAYEAGPLPRAVRDFIAGLRDRLRR